MLSESYLNRFRKIAGLNEDTLKAKFPEGVQELADYAKRHDIDCGQVFYHPGDRKLYLDVSDSGGQDKQTGEDYEDVFVARAQELGFPIEDIIIENETGGPREEDGWVQVPTKAQYEGDDE